MLAAIVAGHLFRPPDLSMLPEAERPAVARALAKTPGDRWPDCRSFVAAVRERHPGVDVHQCGAEEMPFADATFDLIASNPPYVPKTDHP